MRIATLSPVGSVRRVFDHGRSLAAVLMVMAAFVAATASLPAQATTSASLAHTVAESATSRSTQLVALRARINQRFVTAENAGNSALIANRAAADLWERFELTRLSGGKVTLRAQINGRFVCADAAGGSALIANRPVADLWESFQLISNADGSISLRALVNGRIVTAENAGNSPLIANRSAIGPWEKFDLVPANDSSTPPPSAGDQPHSGNTGPANTSALQQAGSRTVTTANAVLSNLDVSGTVTIAAPGVRITNSRIHGSGYYGILVRSGSVVIEDTEIYGFENAIAGDHWSAYRVDIHSTTGDGVKLGSDVVLQDSWIHDLAAGPGAHSDGGQMQSGVTNLVVRHNTIDMSSSSVANAALFLAPDLGPSTNGPVTIDGNWLNGGNYVLFCVDGSDGRYLVKNIVISNNKFGRSSNYGAANVNVTITEYGNTWADNGQPLSLS